MLRQTLVAPIDACGLRRMFRRFSAAVATEIASERLETHSSRLSPLLRNSKPRHARGFLFIAPSASSWRAPPSRPRASARSRGSASGLRGGHRQASTAMAGLPARPWPRPMPRALAARASALAAWRSTARWPRGRRPSTVRRRVLRDRTQGSTPRSSRRS